MSEPIAIFEKVSLEQWNKDAETHYGQSWNLPLLKVIYDGIKLPCRATSGSAGHDFYMPYAIVLDPGKSVVIPTGIRCKIADMWWLSIMPRSSLGFKYSVYLANTIGVIDSDYYNADNEGHIMIKLVNFGTAPMTLGLGERFAQGIFLPYGVASNSANVETERTGGMGSTGTK